MRVSLSPQKTDVKKMVKLLEGEFETSEQAANAALKLAWELYENSAKFIVAVQEVDPVTRAPFNEPLHEGAPGGNATGLSVFRTAKQAKDSALGATYSPDKKRTANTWVLPMHFGSPSTWWRDTAKTQGPEVDPQPQGSGHSKNALVSELQEDAA